MKDVIEELERRRDNAKLGGGKNRIEFSMPRAS